MKIIVAQMGARMHYAVPRMLCKNSLLLHFFTDFLCPPGLGAILDRAPSHWLPRIVKSVRRRRIPDIPDDMMSDFKCFALKYAARSYWSGYHGSRTQTDLWAGKTFCGLIVKKNLANATHLYCFNSAGLELMQVARQLGIRVILEQTMAPRKSADRILAEEEQRFPEWVSHAGASRESREFAIRELEEWKQADLIVCGSEFVREEIDRCGGPSAKVSVVPYGFDYPGPRRDLMIGENAKKTLNVLFAGEVGLRKGAPYLIETARRLKGQLKVVFAGRNFAPRRICDELSDNTTFLGMVSPDRLHDLYAWADVFVLPSLCEGSATVIYEAMAHSLPIICTPNSGSVVRDGIEGFIVRPRDVERMCELLVTLRSDKELLSEMSRNAYARSREFTTQKYADRLTLAIRGL